MSKTSRLRFRHHQAIWVAAVIAFLGALPLATARWYLTPLLLVPVTVGVWAWRAGTDADRGGVRIRALLGQRTIPWSEIVELAAGPRGHRDFTYEFGPQLAALGVLTPFAVLDVGPFAMSGHGNRLRRNSERCILA